MLRQRFSGKCQTPQDGVPKTGGKTPIAQSRAKWLKAKAKRRVKLYGNAPVTVIL
jgi:hypothetical protein